jgi:hypothetical protein
MATLFNLVAAHHAALFSIVKFAVIVMAAYAAIQLLAGTQPEVK